MVSFRGNLHKPAPERQTILNFNEEQKGGVEANMLTCWTVNIGLNLCLKWTININ